MRKMIMEYIDLFSKMILILIFCFASFYIFINIYHSKQLNKTVNIDIASDQRYINIVNNLAEIEKNVDFNVLNYTGEIDRYDITNMVGRLNLCNTKLNNSYFKAMNEMTEISITDVYTFLSIYRADVVSGCVVGQLFYLTTIGTDDKDALSFPPFNTYQPYFKLVTNEIVNNASYFEAELLNNGSYYYNSNMADQTVFNSVSSHFSNILSAYERTSNYVVEISRLLNEEVTNNEKNH